MLTADQTVKVEQPPASPITTTTAVTWGLSTYISIAIIVISAASAIYAGIKENDTASVTAAATGLATALGAIASRTSQANTLTKTAGSIATATVVSQTPASHGPIEVNASFTDHEAEDLFGGDLPSDEVEFANAPEGDNESAIHPDVPR